MIHSFSEVIATQGSAARRPVLKPEAQEVALFDPPLQYFRYFLQRAGTQGLRNLQQMHVPAMFPRFTGFWPGKVYLIGKTFRSTSGL